MSGLFDVEGDMGWEERGAWIALVVAVATIRGVLRPHPETGGWRALDEVAYRSTFLWTIGVSIVRVC